MNKDLDERIETFAKLLYRSRYLVFFTGAGISTESGLPDFRGPDGIWTRRDKGLTPEPLNKPWNLFEPNSGHLAIVELQNIGKLKFLISQNVDNLHLKSGIRLDLLAELHGNITRFRCTGCGKTIDRSSGKKSVNVEGPLSPVSSILASPFRKEISCYLLNTHKKATSLSLSVPVSW